MSIGLVIAAAIYFGDERAPVQRAATIPEAGTEPSVADTTPARAESPPPATEPHPATRFDFYDMLPQFEVVVPETERGAAEGRAATAVQEAGNYVIQAGSFRALADADRMQATLALLGIESRIQPVPIDDDVYHRVRIGPIDDLEELNMIRRRLWDADIEVLLLRVPN
ncbi:MAG TPA: SPOR domain-containing protein [Gammaproteobacteria bacterium]|nr:SPOR domain-containing protein [Gammaproteobacteria bacterium]